MNQDFPLTFVCNNNKNPTNSQYVSPQNLNSNSSQNAPHQINFNNQFGGLPSNNNLNFNNNNNNNNNIQKNPFASINNNKKFAMKKAEESHNNNIENNQNDKGSQQIIGNEENKNKLFESKLSFSGEPKKNKEIVEDSNLNKNIINSNDNNFNNANANKANIQNPFHNPFQNQNPIQMSLKLSKYQSCPEGTVKKSKHKRNDSELLNPKKEVGERQDFSYNTRLGYNLTDLSYQNNRLE